MPEKMVELRDEAIGLVGYLVLHSRACGPAFGGIRAISYPSEAACRADAERLAEAMTYKCLINDIPGGGGKVALMAQSIRDRRAVMAAVGDAVEALAGSFFTGTDSGTTNEDLQVVALRTRHVAASELGAEAAQGVLHAIAGVCAFLEVTPRQLTFAVQGLGAVGLRVATQLQQDGGRVFATDTDAALCARAAALGINIVAPAAILAQPCDVLVPCALGGILTADTVPLLRCRAVVGAANNQLSSQEVTQLLHNCHILYVPDFLANSGATIRGAWRHLRGTPGTDAEIAAIAARTRNLLISAREQDISPWQVAMQKIGKSLTP